MTSDTLKKYIKHLPLTPGVYLFKDTRKRNLYVGKATNLKNRVSSYLKTKDHRIMKMVELAQSLKFISTPSDIEALILESQLIKNFRPKFNIVMRDDKQYFYVGFNKSNFPKIFITHQTQSSHFIGPFTDGNALKTTLRFLRSVFPYCTCTQLHHNYCLNYHIGKCPGFCCLKDGPERSRRVTKEKGNYMDSIEAINKILGGKKNSYVGELTKEADNKAKQGDFGKAIELRNKIIKLEKIFANAKIIKNSDILKTHRYRVPWPAKARPGDHSETELSSLLKTVKPIIRIEGYDISNIQGKHATGSMVTFINGQPDKNFYRKFKIYTKQTPDDTTMLKEILERRFKHDEWSFPDLILIDGGRQQLRAAETIVNPKSKILNPKKMPIIALAKNKKHIGEKIYISNRKNPLPLTKLSPADRNLLLAIDSEAHRFAISYYRKLHRNLFK
jgi:excinuclease ABC subunit C